MWTSTQLESILDALPARVSWWDQDLRSKYVNAALVRFAGTSRAWFVGRGIEDMLGKAWLEENAEFFTGVLAGKPQQFGWAGVREGVEQYFDVRLFPMGDRGFVVLSLDSTELVHAQQAARRDDAQAAVLSERNRVAADLGGAVIEALEVAKAELAAGETAVAGRHLDEVMNTLRSTIRVLYESPEPTPTPTTVRIGVELLKSEAKQHDEPIEPSGLDVDELRALLDGLPVAIAACDREFRNSFANDTAVATYGLGSADAILGTRMDEGEGDRWRSSHDFAEAALTGRRQEFVRTLVTDDGAIRTEQVDYVPQLVAGEIVGVVSQVFDVTEQVAANDGAATSSKRLSVLVDRARIAEDLHDLVIQRLYAAGLIVTARDGDSPQSIALAMGCVDDAVAALRQSLVALQDDPEVSVPLKEAVERLAAQAARSLGFAPHLEWAGDTDCLSEVVAVDVLAVVGEALSNATRHSGAGRVDITVEVTSDQVWVRLADDGVGLPQTPDRTSGLANLSARADRQGGTFDCYANVPHGTVVEWSCPLH